MLYYDALVSVLKKRIEAMMEAEKRFCGFSTISDPG